LSLNFYRMNAPTNNTEALKAINQQRVNFCQVLHEAIMDAVENYKINTRNKHHCLLVSCLILHSVKLYK